MRAEGIRTTERRVEMVTLNDVLERAKPQTIDFLKIDAEGTEREVLLGIDLRVWRPRLLLIEATFPNSDSVSPTVGRSRSQRGLPVCVVRWDQSVLRRRRAIISHRSPRTSKCA